MNRLLILSILFCIYVSVTFAAPRQHFERQLSFDTDKNDSDNDNVRPRGFVQRIFDIIRSLLGFENRQTVVRNDGTVVEIEPENEGFVSRMTRRILNIVSKLLNTFTNRNDDKDDRTTNVDARYRATNEIEHEFIGKKPESNVVLS